MSTTWNNFSFGLMFVGEYEDSLLCEQCGSHTLSDLCHRGLCAKSDGCSRLHSVSTWRLKYCSHFTITTRSLPLMIYGMGMEWVDNPSMMRTVTVTIVWNSFLRTKIVYPHRAVAGPRGCQGHAPPRSQCFHCPADFGKTLQNNTVEYSSRELDPLLQDVHWPEMSLELFVVLFFL